MNSILYRASSWPGLWAVLNAAAAGALLIGGYLGGSRELMLWAVLPGSWALVALLRHPWRFWIEIDDDGVTTSDGRRLPFGDLQVVLARPAAEFSTAPFPIHAVFRNHIVKIPARLDAPSKQVFDALSAHVPQDSSPTIADIVRDFRNEQAATFGEERVWHCRGRTQFGWISRGEAGINFGLGIMVACTLLIPISIGDNHGEAVGACVAGMFLGLMITTASMAGRSGPKWRDAAYGNGIVVAPVGLAVSQADLIGQLGWDEIRRIAYPVRRGNFRLTRGEDGGNTVLEIHVAGAVVQLLDVYDRSLEVIHERITANWRPPL